MIPIKPEINEMLGWEHVIYAKDQPQYQPFPVLKEHAQPNNIISCWSLSFTERFKLLLFGKLWLRIMTFNHPLQPISLTVDKPLFSE